MAKLKAYKELDKKTFPKLGGDYALDANDNPIEVYEDRSGRRSPKKGLLAKLGGKGK